MRWSPTAVPKDVRARVPVGSGERALAGTDDVAGRWCVGTEAALYLETGHGVDRLVWESIDRAHWDRETGELRIVEVAEYGEEPAVRAISIEEPGRLVELVRERVTASVMLTRAVPVEGSANRSVTVVARRSPTRSGDITYSFLVDDDLDPADPTVRSAARSGLINVREELGL